MKISDEKRRKAVAAIMANTSTYETEAQLLGVSARQLKRWVAAARAGEEKPEEEKPEIVGPAPAKGTGAKEKNPALDAALEAAGEKKNTGAPTEQEKRQAVIDQETYCINALNELKSAIGGTLVSCKYDPPLSLGDPDVERLLKLGGLASMAVRANAQKLYPILVKLLTGPYQIFGALALDGLLMVAGLHSLAKRRGWEEFNEELEKSGHSEARMRDPKTGKPIVKDRPVGGSPTELAAQIERSRKEQRAVETEIKPPEFKGDPPKPGTSINAPAA